MQIAVTVLITVAGLVVGSFLNVVILRLHAGKQFVKGRSSCPKCHHALGALEMVPVASWLALRGRCRHCGKPISPQYPLVELATAATWMVSYLVLMPQGAFQVISFLVWLYVVASFIVLAVYDLRWYLLPDKILLPLAPLALVLAAAGALDAHSWSVLFRPIMAAAIFGGGFYLLALVSKGKWMGGGDIKLAFIIGLLLGVQKTALAMLLAFDAAAVIGVALLLLHRKKRSDMIPFGPFLMAGTFIAYLWGAPIIHWATQSSIF